MVDEIDTALDESDSKAGPDVAFSPPADAPQQMSAREAAQLLASLRHQAKETQKAAPSPVGEGQEQPGKRPEAPQAVPPIQDAAPPQEDTGEPQEVEPAPQAPQLDPPRSWRQDEREHWANLDPALQNYLLQRDREDSAAVRKAQNEAAEQRRAIDAELQKTRQVRAEYEQKLPMALQVANANLQAEFADLKTWDDVAKMAREDPLRYTQWDFAVKRAQALTAEYTQAQQRQEQERLDNWRKYADEQDRLFSEQYPNAGELQNRAREVLKKELGFSDEEMAQAWENNAAFRDHRMQKLIAEFVKGKIANDTLKTKRVVPQVTRPQPAGARPAPVAPQLEESARIINSMEGLHGWRAAKAAADAWALQREANKPPRPFGG